jgi:NAD-dependent DNA ligase
VRLASKLTGWQLDIKTKAQLECGIPLEQLAGIGQTTKQRLTDAGVDSVQQLTAMTVEQLTAVEGVGEKTAQKILDLANQMITTTQESTVAETVQDTAPVEAEGEPVSEPEHSEPVAPKENPASEPVLPASDDAAQDSGMVEDQVETEEPGQDPEETQT